MAKLGNLGRMTTVTTGTGTLTLGSAVAGFLTFAQAGILDGETVTYAIQEGTAAEIGRGVYTASGTTLTRVVLRSTNSNSPISLGGAAQVAITVAAEDMRGMVRRPTGRLTLTSGVPVLTAAVSAAGTVYYTPYDGRMVVPVYDGTDWYNLEVAELSNILANSATGKAGPAAAAAGKVNDLFVWDDAGTPRLTRGPDWTNDTTRSAGTALVNVNGISLNNAAITNGPAASRGTWVGTIMTDAGGATVSWTLGANALNGTAGWFGLWNAYNRRLFVGITGDTADSWTYATTTWRSANSQNTMRCTFVRGADEDVIETEYLGCAKTTAVTVFGQTGVALDATNTFSGPNATIASTGAVPAPSHYKGLPGLGKHFLQATEFASAATVTFFGDSGLTGVQTGLMTSLWA